jgi:hypothetical protein
VKGHGIKIDDRHLMLLADLMTFKGEILVGGGGGGVDLRRGSRGLGL